MSSDAEWISAERDHEFRMEQERTRQVTLKAEARVAVWEAVMIGVVVLGVVVALVVGVWTAVERGAARKERESVECVRSGGTVLETVNGRLCLRLEDGVG